MSLLRPSSFFKQVTPTGAISDLVFVFRQAGPHRWRTAGLAILSALAIFSLVAREEHRIAPRLPTITYINSWRADRSDAEIRAGNIAWQRAQAKLDAEQAARDEEVKGIYKAIGRASGMDVEAIDRKAKADKAAEQRALDAKLAAPAAAPSPAPADAAH